MFVFNNAQAIPIQHGSSTAPPEGYTYKTLPKHRHLSGIFCKQILLSVIKSSKINVLLYNKGDNYE